MGDERDAAKRLDQRLREAGDRLDRLEALARRVVGDSKPPAPNLSRRAKSPEVLAGGHVLFVPTPEGYALLARDGEAPTPGTSLMMPEREEAFVVTKVGASPLPGDARPCAFLQPL
jgi:hypothetical protein